MSVFGDLQPCSPPLETMRNNLQVLSLSASQRITVCAFIPSQSLMYMHWAAFFNHAIRKHVFLRTSGSLQQRVDAEWGRHQGSRNVVLLFLNKLGKTLPLFSLHFIDLPQETRSRCLPLRSSCSADVCNFSVLGLVIFSFHLSWNPVCVARHFLSFPLKWEYYHHKGMNTQRR